VTLIGYQQALCDLIASPRLCLEVRAGHDALAGYDLTDRERWRLVSAAAQRGMSTSCTLYRMNRITPLYSYLPLTCTLLGDDLIAHVERYWDEGKPGDLQFGPETQRFSRFLRRQLEEGSIADPYLGEVLDLELAVNALRWDAEPRTCSVRFRHEPLALLDALAAGRRPDDGAVAAGDYVLDLDSTGGEIRLSAVRREPARA
jgi:hypothetical protein